MYFNYLRTFITVYREGSYAQAASKLNLTHPTVSKHITALEYQLGQELFHRSRSGGKRHAPTALAHNLADELSMHVDRMEEVFATSRSASKQIPRIGV